MFLDYLQIGYEVVYVLKLITCLEGCLWKLSYFRIIDNTIAWNSEERNLFSEIEGSHYVENSLSLWSIYFIYAIRRCDENIIFNVLVETIKLSLYNVTPGNKNQSNLIKKIFLCFCMSAIVRKVYCMNSSQNLIRNNRNSMPMQLSLRFIYFFFLIKQYVI